MAEELRKSLADLEGWLKQLARPTLAMLQPGVEPSVVASSLARRGLETPADLVELWAWRNGTGGPADAKLGDLWLVPGFYLCSVEEAVANFDAFVTNPRWRPGWLPLLADGGGDFLAVDCAPGEAHGAVYHFRFDDFEQPLEFRSIERMAATFAAAYQLDAFYINADGTLDEDYAAYGQVGLELNPDVPWWRDTGI